MTSLEVRLLTPLEICCEEMVKRDTPGYAIGGLAGGEDKGDFCRTVFKTAQMLPENKP